MILGDLENCHFDFFKINCFVLDPAFWICFVLLHNLWSS
jgi:hypothetical protein